MSGPYEKCLRGMIVSLYLDHHASVGFIAREAGETEPIGLLPGIRAEEHALDPTGNGNAQSFHILT